MSKVCGQDGALCPTCIALCDIFVAAVEIDVRSEDVFRRCRQICISVGDIPKNYLSALQRYLCCYVELPSQHKKRVDGVPRDMV